MTQKLFRKKVVIFDKLFGRNIYGFWKSSKFESLQINGVAPRYPIEIYFPVFNMKLVETYLVIMFSKYSL